MMSHCGARPLRPRDTAPPVAFAFVWMLLLTTPVTAQEWPSGPVSLFGGRVVLGGEALITVAPEDSGFFNYTDYDRSALRLVRLGVVTTIQPSRHVSFVGEFRAEGQTTGGEWSGEPYAAYVRIRPWLHRTFEVHAGRIPPAFGGFLRRSYGRDNPLIGYPLAYQYLTSLRSDSIPRNADDLIGQRGAGWYTGYPVGSAVWSHGVPIVSAFRYDTGVLTRFGFNEQRFEVLGSVTTGTLSNPRVGDDNGSPQIAGRAVFRPAVGLVVGASAARGAFLADALEPVLPAGTGVSAFTQKTLGADIEYSKDYWLVRTEWLRTSWRLPALSAPAIDRPLGASAIALEGRYTLAPGLYAAVRVDRLWFTSIRATEMTLPWDANVSRLEAGLGYSLVRNVVLKGSYQYNRRDGGRVRRAHLGAAQLLLWF
jgi:hypothetical protein